MSGRVDNGKRTGEIGEIGEPVGELLETAIDAPVIDSDVPTLGAGSRPVTPESADSIGRRADYMSRVRSQPETSRRHSDRLRHLLIAADALALIVGMATAFLVQRIFRPVSDEIMMQHLWLCVASLPAFALGAGLNHLYLARANERPLDEMRNLLRTAGVGVGWILVVAFVAQYDGLSRLWVFALVVSVFVALFVERRIARRVFARLRNTGRIRRRIVIVGTDAHAIALMHAYQRNPALGYEVVGFVGDDPLVERGDINLLGPVDDVSAILLENGAGGVVISLASIREESVNVLARQLTDDGFHVALSSSLRDIDVTRLRPQQLDGRTMIYIEPTIRYGWRAAAKRAFDVVLASTIVILTAPIQVVAAIAIKLDTRGPVFFRQVRVGKNGELFEIIKLRTMTTDAEERRAELAEHNEVDGPLFKMRNDPRVTRVGRVLRKLSIDELPQLFCVLAGSMSMVGPRPALPSEVEQWDVEVRQRLRVFPGLTGLWQVSGRSDSSFEQYKRMDLYYVDNWSLAHDLKICAKTVRTVLTTSGAA